MTDVTAPTVDAVHVWHARLTAAPEDYAVLERLLAADERDRAARFQHQRDRERYVIGRGLLRQLLGFAAGSRSTAEAAPMRAVTGALRLEDMIAAAAYAGSLAP